MSIGPAGLGKGLCQTPVQGTGGGADKTSRSCLLFSWRKAAKGFSKTICPLVGDFVSSLPLGTSAFQPPAPANSESRISPPTTGHLPRRLI